MKDAPVTVTTMESGLESGLAELDAVEKLIAQDVEAEEVFAELQRRELVFGNEKRQRSIPRGIVIFPRSAKEKNPTLERQIGCNEKRQRSIIGFHASFDLKTLRRSLENDFLTCVAVEGARPQTDDIVVTLKDR